MTPLGQFLLILRCWDIYAKTWSQFCRSFHDVKVFALPCLSERTTLIQRQISCNIQKDKKMCVNANIYSI